MTPAPGDFGVTRTGGLGGWAIRFGTRSSVNHAFVFIGHDDDLGCDAIIEAQPGGAVKSAATEWPAATWSTIPLTDSDRASIVHWAKAQIGVGYGWVDIAALTLYVLFRIRPRFVIARIERLDRLICSQLVDKAYMLAGVHLFADDRPTSEVTPGDLLDVIRRAA